MRPLSQSPSLLLKVLWVAVSMTFQYCYPQNKEGFWKPLVCQGRTCIRFPIFSSWKGIFQSIQNNLKWGSSGKSHPCHLYTGSPIQGFAALSSLIFHGRLCEVWTPTNLIQPLSTFSTQRKHWNNFLLREPLVRMTISTTHVTLVWVSMGRMFLICLVIGKNYALTDS